MKHDLRRVALSAVKSATLPFRMATARGGAEKTPSEARTPEAEAA